MAVPSNTIQAFDVLVDGIRNIRTLQRDMANNAVTWKTMAQAQSPDVATIASYMNNAAQSYNNRLVYVTNLVANTALWNRVKAIWAILGGTVAEFSAVTNPLQAVASQLGPADKSSYAAIISACDQILAAIPLPDSAFAPGY